MSGPCRRWVPLVSADEQRLQDRVVRELGPRFPALTDEAVRSAVLSVWERYDEAPVRDFVPVLAAKDAAELLSARTDGA